MKFDLLNFYRDNLIASSGTVGDWIDLALIPELLGVTLPERLLKWRLLKKLGTALLDTSLEGRVSSGQSPINTIFNGYDDTIKTQAIQAIQVAIDSIEQNMYSITGVFRERLNGIEQKDAVTNVKIGLNNSFIITKLYYHLMDLVVSEMLLDCLNLAKVVFKKGLTGTLILGDRYQKVFTALPEHFTVSDHDIHLTTSGDIVKDLEQIKTIVPDLVKANLVQPDLVFEIITCKSLSEAKAKVKLAIKKQKEENSQLLLLSLLAELLLDLLLLAQLELLKAQQLIESLNQAKLQIEQLKLLMENEIEWYKALTDRTYKLTMAEEAKKRTLAELALLSDGNPYNDKIVQLGR